jgi:hypothetical protein
MTSECLARYIHISDLHFGDIGRNGELLHPWWLRLLWKWLPAFSGLAGHEFQALLDLSDCFARKRPEWGQPGLIVTGDLTSLGKERQFNTIRNFICNQLPSPPFDVGIGLHTGSWLADAMRGKRAGCPHQVIPGNHDHWPGRYYMLGPPQSRMVEWAPHLPYLLDAIPLSGTPASLRFMGLNSDADVGGWRRERVLARGSCCSQIHALWGILSQRVRQPDPDEIRVLLVHHSLAYRSRPEDAPPRTHFQRLRQWWSRTTDLGILEMDDRSRLELSALIAEFDIRVLLTGHTHKVDVRRNAVLSPQLGRPAPYLEACCGTTTQLNTAPAGYPLRNRPAGQEATQPGQEQQIAANTFLVHELRRENGSIVWQTETWERLPIQGFQRSPRNARGEPYSSRFPVWRQP